MIIEEKKMRKPELGLKEFSGTVNIYYTLKLNVGS